MYCTTQVRCESESLQFVSHRILSGLKTLVAESYQKPSDVKVKEIFSCPVDTPWVIAKAGPKEIMSIPKMYRSEYTTYGSGRPVTVT